MVCNFGGGVAYMRNRRADDRLWLRYRPMACLALCASLPRAPILRRPTFGRSAFQFGSSLFWRQSVVNDKMRRRSLRRLFVSQPASARLIFFGNASSKLDRLLVARLSALLVRSTWRRNCWTWRRLIIRPDQLPARHFGRRGRRWRFVNHVAP